jgi:transcriptional regulator with XRE-family HTH domain
MDTKKTGRFISALRKEKGYTQAALAEILNVSNRTISKWENGDGYPDITILPDIAAAFEISVDELLAGERKPKEEVADIKVTEIENKDNLLNIFNRLYYFSFLRCFCCPAWHDNRNILHMGISDTVLYTLGNYVCCRFACSRCCKRACVCGRCYKAWCFI